LKRQEIILGEAIFGSQKITKKIKKNKKFPSNFCRKLSSKSRVVMMTSQHQKNGDNK